MFCFFSQLWSSDQFFEWNVRITEPLQPKQNANKILKVFIVLFEFKYVGIWQKTTFGNLDTKSNYTEIVSMYLVAFTATKKI